MLGAILDVAGQVGLPVVFALIAIETMGIPVPGETALITAALLAARGHLDLGALIAVAATAAILGDNVGYLVGRRLGRRLLFAPGPLARQRRRALEIGEPFFARHGPKAVFLGRWVAGLRITAPWMAGANRMRWPTFLFWNALGGVAWAASVAGLAFSLGEGAERAIRTAGLAGAGGVVLAGAILFVVARARRRGARRLDRDAETT